jgi:PAS domain S-box-containing protein/putative nucleotidyltransferase with HDIG domain
MLEGKPLVLHKDEAHLSEAERREYTDYLIHSKLFVPLLAQGELVGYTEIWESRRKREFTQHEIHLAQAIASYAASVIRAANLFAELEKREAYFRALIENSAEGIAVIDRQGIILYQSPALKQLMGYEAKESIGQNVFDDLHPEDTPRLQRLLEEGIRTPGAIIHFEYRARHADGTWRRFEAVGHNLLHEPFIQGVVINYRDITERTLAEERLAHAYDSTLEGWARALELRDKDTEGHTRRVTELAVKLARAMGLTEEQIVHLRRGAILHDIGKISVPDSILHKTAPLTEAEQAIIRKHPLHAYAMLSPIEYLRPALDIPYCHHEKWDGTGYPRGLKGEEIPLAARIFAVADVYDALTSDRPYRPAWTKEAVISYIRRQRGRHFDPQVVDAFLTLMAQEQG